MVFAMRTHRTSIVAATMALGFLCSLAAGAAEPLYDGLGNYERKITTASPDAQKYFNQGLAFQHGFNHGAALRSFEEAARIDPTCAMAHWAIAFASGPHINFPFVPPEAAERAWKHLKLAQEHSANCTPVEKDLIDALAHRYANPQPEDRAPLDQAFADAMRKVWQKYPQDADVGAWTAEALMDLRPWDQWTPEGQAQPGTEEVIATLDAVLKLNINHPLANHLYIHAVEASPHPERAEAAANRLRDLQPGIAHNVHMPSHIDIRMGLWHKAIDSNEKAIAADQAYRKVVGQPQGFINLYVAHNRHMLAFAAMMVGQRERALRHINAMVEQLPESFINDYKPVAESFVAMPDEVMVRFGMWDEVLALPEVDAQKMPFVATFRHAAKSIAHAAKGDVDQARAEQRAFLEAMKTVPKETAVGNNPAESVFAVIVPMVEGEILLREKKVDDAVAKLREAIAAEDKLRYDEPPGWLIPVRHSLGALLMNEGRFAEAEQVYREDLKHLPNNGWSLYGLSRSLEAQGKDEEAVATQAEFKKVWTGADIEIDTSCLCQPPTAQASR
jgi:tetratricopeptide (TPR) repeat protein